MKKIKKICIYIVIIVIIITTKQEIKAATANQVLKYTNVSIGNFTTTRHPSDHSWTASTNGTAFLDGQKHNISISLKAVVISPSYGITNVLNAPNADDVLKLHNNHIPVTVLDLNKRPGKPDNPLDHRAWAGQNINGMYMASSKYVSGPIKIWLRIKDDTLGTLIGGRQQIAIGDLDDNGHGGYEVVSAPENSPDSAFSWEGYYGSGKQSVNHFKINSKTVWNQGVDENNHAPLKFGYDLNPHVTNTDGYTHIFNYWVTYDSFYEADFNLHTLNFNNFTVEVSKKTNPVYVRTNNSQNPVYIGDYVSIDNQPWYFTNIQKTNGIENWKQYFSSLNQITESNNQLFIRVPLLNGYEFNSLENSNLNNSNTTYIDLKNENKKVSPLYIDIKGIKTHVGDFISTYDGPWKFTWQTNIDQNLINSYFTNGLSSFLKVTDNKLEIDNSNMNNNFTSQLSDNILDNNREITMNIQEIKRNPVYITYNNDTLDLVGYLISIDGGNWHFEKGANFDVLNKYFSEKENSLIIDSSNNQIHLSSNNSYNYTTYLNDNILDNNHTTRIYVEDKK